MNLKQLSHRLGLSQTTVSRALNGYPEVGEATRQRVLSAAARYNYRPNSRAKGLATGRSHTIGHVLPTTTRHEVVNPIFGDFIAGAGEVYAANDYEMVLSIVEDDTEEEVYRAFKTRGTVDGVILHGPKLNDRRITLLQEIGLPFVVHGRASGVAADYSWVDVNNTSAFARATEFLIDLGHRRIALINGPEEMDFAHRRRCGYEDGLTRRGLPADPALMRSDEMTERFGYDSACALLGAADPPTAFLVASVISALGVRRAVEERGLRLARDISVVTFDDMLSYLDNGGQVPVFTATRSSVRDAGRRAARLLLAQIAAPASLPDPVLLEAELTVGQSTGPARPLPPAPLTLPAKTR
ncbi:LacI family DNA-binding transcriptional regulator [Thalassorhabdomicrobium marinisediminis]|uniref:LacI family transcriptional regulator n=1 Tax=Thalassorhabdomicrobium marinisediminis TaxID=2170577 RepID=A0A2T7FV22_9RHOB|nr:substrate-binding domain-containing protein [Thalassorhabdomicrobium marinisediminis]PVA06002.1 LacI family transcriptional regulator [Thalassorhabdomicrobium marinisediminis]